MPVEDLNAERMLEGIMNTAEAAETTSEFWSVNADLPAIVIVTIIIIFMFVATFVFGWFLISKALKKFKN